MFIKPLAISNGLRVDSKFEMYHSASKINMQSLAREPDSYLKDRRLHGVKAILFCINFV